MREAMRAKIVLVGVWLCGVIAGACGGPHPPLDRSPTCRDGVRNGRETDVDCGGGCIPCTPQQRCHTGQDCTSGRCTSGTCAAPTRTDGIANGTEFGVDCGGSCAPERSGDNLSDCLGLQVAHPRAWLELRRLRAGAS